jgi:hypothetical protein
MTTNASDKADPTLDETDPSTPDPDPALDSGAIHVVVTPTTADVPTDTEWSAFMGLPTNPPTLH